MKNTFGVLIDKFVNEKGTTVKVCEYLRFIDSFKMMNSSLEKLVEILSENQFEIMKSMFPTVWVENILLLKKKGYYAYSYMSSRVKFSDKQLPPLENWGNALDCGNVNITESNLAHANRMRGNSWMWNTSRLPRRLLKIRLCTIGLCLGISRRIQFYYL